MTDINMNIYFVQLGGKTVKNNNINFPVIITFTSSYIYLAYAW